MGKRSAVVRSAHAQVGYPPTHPPLPRPRINANTWTAGVRSSSNFGASAGAYLSRSEKSVNTPLVDKPQPPLGLLGR